MEKTVRQKRDFTNGKVLKNLVLFAIPMALATFLQMLFNAADIAIVGQFGGSQYQAAVGATSSTIHLIVNLFIGISIGANVAMANAYGAKDEERQERVVHTAMAASIVSGVFVLIVGIFLSRTLMQLIKTPTEIIDYAVIYMQIYFLGAPALMVYNFGAALMRGVGETQKPLLYLFVSGALNVVINAVTVIFLDMNVVGVALGTVISQYLSAVWIVLDLRKADGGLKYSLRKTRFCKKEIATIVRIGIPMGISSCLFSFSNLFVQSSVNAYGEAAIAGNTVSVNIDTLGDSFGSAIEKSVVTFVGQNIGAKKKERVHRIIGAGLFAGGCCMGVYCLLMATLGRFVCSIYNADPAVLDWAMRRVHIVSVTYILVLIMGCYGGALRGMGYSFFPMLINLVFTCFVRIAYLSFIYPSFATQTIEQIYILYPLTWILSGSMQLLSYYIVGAKQGHFRKKTPD